MARIRTIKPEFWTDSKIIECSLSARLLFIGMWNFADDMGNLDRSAKQIKARVFPADSVDCEPLVQELIAQGLLTEYSVSGKFFLNIPSFRKHQVINRPSAPQCPLPEYSVSHPVVIHEDSCPEGKGREGKKDIVGLAPDESSKKTELRKSASEVIAYLNEKAGRRYDLNGANADAVMARLRDGETVDACRAVVDAKCQEWLGDEKMAKYLRPETLFNRTKFASYKGEISSAKGPKVDL